MKAKINENCIGCGTCISLCPEIFDFNDEGLAKVILEDIPEDKLEELNSCIEMCPTQAIEKLEK